MKILRSHIARLTVVLLVGFGFFLYMVQPAQAEYTSDSFTSWLRSMTKVSESEKADLHKKLQELHHSEEHLTKIIEKASEIVVQNNHQFDFNFKDTDAFQRVYQFLLIEWNQYQTGNAMAGLPVQQTVKSLAPLKVDNVHSVDFGTIWPAKKLGLLSQYIENFKNQVESSVAIIPMDECIAIGAP